MKPRIIIRLECNELVGFGHFTRCMATARLLGTQYECCFVMAPPPEWVIQELERCGLTLIVISGQAQYHPDDADIAGELAYDLDTVVCSDDLVVLDGYRFGVNYRRQLGVACRKVIQFFDEVDLHAAVDGFITPLILSSEERLALENRCSVFDGSDGFLIRPEFYLLHGSAGAVLKKTFIYVTQIKALEFYKQQPLLQDCSVLALTNATYRDACASMGWETLIDANADEVVVSMLGCNSALLPASSVALEFLVVRKMKPFVFVTAENQSEGFKRMVSAGYWSDATEFGYQHGGIGVNQNSLPNPAIGLRNWMGDL